MLSGECTLIVEEEERPLRQWDYFHCPANTRHVIVGTGDRPCAILMIGARPEVETLRYPVSEVAAKYGASAVKATDEPDEAYADWPGEYLAGAAAVAARFRDEAVTVSSTAPRQPGVLVKRWSNGADRRGERWRTVGHASRACRGT